MNITDEIEAKVVLEWLERKIEEKRAKVGEANDTIQKWIAFSELSFTTILLEDLIDESS